MKNFLIGVFLLIFAISCEQGKNKQPEISALAKAAADTLNYTEIQWIDSVANFGIVKMGEKVEVKFKFKNVGTKPLLLLQVQAGCGCTTPDYTKEPVAPGKEGWVNGIFNSENQRGEVHKYIMVKSNTKNGVEHRLTFTGVVNNESEQKEPLQNK